jgi:hypothetical protein
MKSLLQQSHDAVDVSLRCSLTCHFLAGGLTSEQVSKLQTLTRSPCDAKDGDKESIA